jgi:hypothetical protein
LNHVHFFFRNSLKGIIFHDMGDHFVNPLNFTKDIQFIRVKSNTKQVPRYATDKNHSVLTIRFSQQSWSDISLSFCSRLHPWDVRWFHYQDYLRKNREKYQYVIITDVTDVEILKDPFPFMENNRDRDLFVGLDKFGRNGDDGWMQVFINWLRCILFLLEASAN